MFKKFFSSVFLLVILLTVHNVCNAEDMKVSDWAYDSVVRAGNCGIIAAEDYICDYTKPITRIEIADIVASAYKAINGDVAVEGNPFSDTDSENAAIVNYLEIMNGCGNGLFCPEGLVTREAMAKIIVLLQEKLLHEQFALPFEDFNAPSVYTDFSSVSDWAKPHVYNASLSGIFNGYENGIFLPQGNITKEEVIALVMRCYAFVPGKIPTITSLEKNMIISSGDRLSVKAKDTFGFQLYAIGCEQGASLVNVGYGNDTTPAVISGGTLRKNSAYTFFVCDNSTKALSAPVMVYTDQYGLFVNYTSSCNCGNAKISWNSVPNAENTSVTLVQTRTSLHPERTQPSEPVTYKIPNKTNFEFYAQPNRKYAVTLTAGPFTKTFDITVNPVKNAACAEMKQSLPKTKEEAEAMMVTITVPIWKLKNGKKVASKASLQVNPYIADKYVKVFEEIFNGSEKFPISSVGAYSWRGGTSEHNYGTAVDVNPDENYCIYSDGRTVGKSWLPYEDPFAITPYGDVMNAFENNGFTWGGDAWDTPIDYMHFSFFGK